MENIAMDGICNHKVHENYVEKVSLLTGEMAQKIANAAFLAAQNYRLMVSITVVDRSGQTLAFFKGPSSRGTYYPL